jgi:Fe-S-cluster containining protein
MSLDPKVVKLAQGLMKLYRGIDATLADGLAKQGITPSCRQGCSHCCYQLTTITPLEALPLAISIEAFPSFRKRSAINRLGRSLRETLKSTDRVHHFERQLPCALLEHDLCSLYPVRPAPCRYMLVVSDPQQCAPQNGHTVSAVNTFSLQNLVWEMNAHTLYHGELVASLISGPLPMMVLHALQQHADPKTAKQAGRQLEGAPTPMEWSVQMLGQPGNQASPEELTAAQEALDRFTAIAT